jgi:hypothetical protein
MKPTPARLVNWNASAAAPARATAGKVAAQFGLSGELAVQELQEEERAQIAAIRRRLGTKLQDLLDEEEGQ